MSAIKNSVLHAEEQVGGAEFPSAGNCSQPLSESLSVKIGCLWYKGVSSSPLCYDWGGLADSTLHSSLDVGVDLNPLRF